MRRNQLEMGDSSCLIRVLGYILFRRVLWYDSAMNFVSFIGRFLSVLAITGLALLPFAKPAMPLSAATHEVMDHHSAMGMQQDHNCCPKQAPASHCGVDCLAICAAQFFCQVMQVPMLAHELGSAVLVLPHNDVWAGGLKERPPPRPPKI
jgi:hypothetical protein